MPSFPRNYVPVANITMNIGLQATFSCSLAIWQPLAKVVSSNKILGNEDLKYHYSVLSIFVLILNCLKSVFFQPLPSSAQCVMGSRKGDWQRKINEQQPKRRNSDQKNCFKIIGKEPSGVEWVCPRTGSLKRRRRRRRRRRGKDTVPRFRYYSRLFTNLTLNVK